jgi:hypothetical protein
MNAKAFILDVGSQLSPTQSELNMLLDRKPLPRFNPREKLDSVKSVNLKNEIEGGFRLKPSKI